MPELRLNLVTREWVVISPERASRPDDFKGAEGGNPGAIPLGEENHDATHREDCPFCAGNEAASNGTLGELYRLHGDEKGSWRVRVVENKFPAVESEGAKERRRDGLHCFVSGVGLHEVIIESPLHNASMATMELSEIEDILHTYRERFIDAHEDIRVENVIIFKNHGASAGTSIDHPHSQLVAVPVVPVQFRDRVQAAMHYFDNTGQCMMCDIISTEEVSGERIITDSEDFLTFIPYAALSPYQSWILPKNHSATFATITEEEISDLAHHVRNLLAKLDKALGDPDYNLILSSSRPSDDDNEYCHWYITVTPRLSNRAGFEMGTGMYINPTVPEHNAKHLQDIDL